MTRLSKLTKLSDQEKADRGLLHTPGEILQQPSTWATTFLNFQQQRAEVESFLKSVGIQAEPEARPIVYLIGAGTSDYVGQSVADLLRQKWQCEVVAVASTDLLGGLGDYVLHDRRYLWISFSRSGDTPEAVAVLEKALVEYPEISHLVVCCNANGKMVQDHRQDPRVFAAVLDDAVNDRGLAMTSSFSNMVVYAQCLANVWSVDQYEPILHALIAGGEKFVESAADLASELAEGPYSSICYVGSGALKAVARESALKSSELTAGRIRTMSESTLGLRHGPLAALNHETLFVALVSKETRRQRYELDLLREIGRKGVVPTRVAVALETSEKLAEVAEHVLAPGLKLAVPDFYRPPLDVIFGQSLGLFFSLHFGIKPDTPSPAGVITRVVQSVTIY